MNVRKRTRNDHMYYLDKDYPTKISLIFSEPFDSEISFFSLSTRKVLW